MLKRAQGRLYVDDIVNEGTQRTASVTVRQERITMEAGVDDSEWIRQISALTSGTDGRPACQSPSSAEQLVARLGALARACVLDPTDTADRLHGIAGWHDAALLADDLARYAPGHEVASLSGIALSLRYVEALREASSAVYFCRRMQHASGSCWFSTAGPDDGLCGRVLTVGHRLRAPLAASGTPPR